MRKQEKARRVSVLVRYIRWRSKRGDTHEGLLKRALGHGYTAVEVCKALYRFLGADNR